MTPVLFVAVAIAGGLGAGLRYLVDIAVMSRSNGRFPWGILVVNTTGSFALGLLTGAAPPVELLWLVGVGVLGGYTTFSTVAVSSVLLAEERVPRMAVASAVGTLAATVVAAGIGLWLGMR